MLFLTILALVVFAVRTLAAPLNLTLAPPTSLVKRADPLISKNFSQQGTKQIQRGFYDVLQLADSVVSEAKNNPEFDRIFVRYFDKKDRQFVLSVFEKILDNDKMNGNDLLSNIRVVVDYPDSRKTLSCVTEAGRATQAELRDPASKTPNLVLCNSAMKTGAIDFHFNGIDDVNCKTLDPRVSTRMENLGGILLHEYTHWQFLMKPLFNTLKLSKKVAATVDIKYGPVEVKRLATTKTYRALINADSYTWLAYEVFWTARCGRTFGAADPSKKDDRALHDNS